ncbi:MAG: PEP-CTERM sorting domain-containing protein [Caldimonas sp.]
MISALLQRSRRGSAPRFIAIELGVLALCSVAHAQTVYSGAGVSAASITPTVVDFRNALGTLNANVAGSFAGGRREINWDGVPDSFAAPNNLPANFFNVNSPRGVVFATPGSGFQVSANAVNPTSTPIEFGNIDPAYPTFFAPFSAQRLFTAIGSNVVDVNFFVPGSAQGALTRGFGVVFSDVDLANTTSMSFFGAAGNLLGTYFAPASGGQEGFSFLGVDYGVASVSRVRITSGNQALAAGSTNLDIVAMDDFIYGEPLVAIPEPETYALLLGGLGALAWRARRRGAAPA